MVGFFSYALVAVSLALQPFARAAEVTDGALLAELIQKDASDLALNLAKRNHQGSSLFQNLIEDSPVICFGEKHKSSFRHFYEKFLFKMYPVDFIYLEGVQNEIDQIVDAVKEGQAQSLLNAPIAGIINAAIDQNPHVQFIGIEPNKKQKMEILHEELKSRRKRITRETFIAYNLLANFVKHPEKRHWALYGAKHCGLSDTGLGNNVPAFRLIQKQIPQAKSVLMTTGEVVLQSLIPVTFWESATLPLVINETHQIDPLDYRTIWKLQSAFKNYTHVGFF